MEDIIKLQIKAIEVKLTVAKEGRKEELEAKIKKLKGLVTPVAIDNKAARRKKREEVKEELPLTVQKKIKKEMIEKLPEVVEPLVVEELPTVEEIEKEIEALPEVAIEDHPMVEEPKNENIVVDGSDKEEPIQPDEEFNQDAEDLEALKEAIIDEPKEEVVPVVEPVIEPPVVKPPVVKKVVETNITTKKKRKYTKRKKAPIKVSYKK